MNPVDVIGKIVELSQSNIEISARIKAILDVLSRDLTLDEVLVFTLEKDRKLTCRFASDQSILSPMLNKYRCLIGEGIIGTVAQKRSPQYFTIKNIPPRFGCLFYPELDAIIGHFRSFSFLPIGDDSYLYGVLVVVSAGRDTAHDPEKAILSICARELGGVLRVNELILSSKKRISELATLSELGKALISQGESETILMNLSLIVARALNAVFVTINLKPTFMKLSNNRFTFGTIDPSFMPRLNALEEEALAKKAGVLATMANAGGKSGSNHVVTLFGGPLLSQHAPLGTIVFGIAAPPPSQATAADSDYQYLIHTIAGYLSSGLENMLLNARLKQLLAELNEAQKRIIEQEKLRGLGEMTASIAHEIKNPLVIIGGFTKRLAKKLKLEEAEARYVDIILKEVARLEAILDEILDYVKNAPVLFEACNINDCIDETLYFVTSAPAWEEITVERHYDANIPLTECDIQQIRQVFMNILANAHDAMRGKGTLTISTEVVSLSKALFVKASFSDTGGGIDPTILDNIFNPFFTTKERGSGLGLPISNKIIINHGGRLEVANTPGRGVTFSVYLPTKKALMEDLP
jgi:signal transduction histidine kinase